MKRVLIDRRYKLAWGGYWYALICHSGKEFRQVLSIAERKFEKGRESVYDIALTKDKRLGLKNYYIGFKNEKDLTMMLLYMGDAIKV